MILVMRMQIFQETLFRKHDSSKANPLHARGEEQQLVLRRSFFLCGEEPKVTIKVKRELGENDGKFETKEGSLLREWEYGYER